MYPNLNAEMARRDISQQKMAEILGMTLATFNNKLSGKVDFKLSEINIICKFFGCTFEYLFEEREDEEEEKQGA